MFGKKYMGIVRSTFVIDENGIITHIFKDVKASEDTQNILKILKQGIWQLHVFYVTLQLTVTHHA